MARESFDHPSPSRTVVGLFAGIGGIELGLHEAGFESSLLCEIDPAARTVLDDRFSAAAKHDDIATLAEIPAATVLAAGFPCQDLSQAGRTKGIRGSQSSLVEHVFRLLDGSPPHWLVLENVSFMLRLERGRAMSYLVHELERRGYRWAYRVVDSRAFGLPQRRQRVVLIASRESDPRPLLFSEDAGEPEHPPASEVANGFYWTEGVRGLGWAVDAIPTLKGGSSIGIPSPPAIWMPDGPIVTPEIRDAERLQGFPPDWTRAASGLKRGTGQRWKLIGNAVSVPVARWIGARLAAAHEDQVFSTTGEALAAKAPWPTAAYGDGKKVHRVDVSMWPCRIERVPLGQFLAFDPAPLSERASNGFLGRASRSSLRFPEGLLAAIEQHVEGMRAAQAA